MLQSVIKRVTQPRIINIGGGGGVGSLSLVQGVKKAAIPFTLCERDPSKDHRPQGYRILINGNGHEALKK
ncbi:hypothetical protein K7432_009581 [Basidiobolus ranarum]|uniref:Uncharacterized protein n=1 Tax=Basidiobolus ranarum TaxID=34480 RepID=A0ABR2VWY2_9FUNG